MKYIKTYEQLITNYLIDLKSLKEKYIKSIKDSMQEVIDEYDTKLELSLLDPDRPYNDGEEDHLYQFKIKIKPDNSIDEFISVLGSSLFKLNKETNSDVQRITIYLQSINSQGFGWTDCLYTVNTYEDLIEKINRYKISNLERPLFDLNKKDKYSDLRVGEIIQSKDLYYISKHNLFNILVVIDLI